jgi:hypothetical protein
MYNISLLFVLFACPISLALSKTFNWSDQQGTHIDLTNGKRLIARYVYEKMDPKDRERTYKPFYHLYDKNGKKFITKGVGGKFTHHRGIYFGFSKCSALDSNDNPVSVDTWHCKRGYQTHEKIIKIHADQNKASLESEIAWRVDDSTIFITEFRELSFRLTKDRRLQIDFRSLLSTTQPEVRLDGDPQHAGFQFRASNDVATKHSKETFYIRTKGGKDQLGKTKNWPQNKDMTNLNWNAQSVVIEGQRYFTLYLDHPSNPKPSFYSERDYGRFGSYFKAKVKPSEPLEVRYRLIFGTEELDSEICESFSDKFRSEAGQ